MRTASPPPQAHYVTQIPSQWSPLSVWGWASTGVTPQIWFDFKPSDLTLSLVEERKWAAVRANPFTLQPELSMCRSAGLCGSSVNVQAVHTEDTVSLMIRETNATPHLVPARACVHHSYSGYSHQSNFGMMVEHPPILNLNRLNSSSGWPSDFRMSMMLRVSQVSLCQVAVSMNGGAAAADTGATHGHRSREIDWRPWLVGESWA